jgi:hypothetical protein
MCELTNLYSYSLVVYLIKFKGELDFTMLRQICRRGRLDAFIQDEATRHTAGDS